MEEKKEYSVIGTVTIGTDEYRDLLTEKFEADREASEQRSKWYEQYSKANKLEEENKKLKEELDKYKKFIKKNSVKIGEEGVTIFMNMLSEDE